MKGPYKNKGNKVMGMGNHAPIACKGYKEVTHGLKGLKGPAKHDAKPL